MSKDAHSAVKNSVASIAAQVTNLLVGLISSVYVARVLGKEQLGIYSWALGVMAIAMSLAHAGIDNVIIRDVARKKDQSHQYLLSAFLAKAVTSSISYIAIIAYFKARQYTGLQLAVGYLLCSTVITEGFNSSCRAVLTGIERQDATATVSVLSNLLRVFLVIMLVQHGYNILAVAWVTVIVSVLVLAVHVGVIARLVGGSWRPSIGAIRHLVVTGWTFLATTFFIGIYDRADYIMLDYFKGVGAVGIYGAAYRIIEIIAIMVLSASFALFPIVSRRVESSEDAYGRALQRSMKYITIMGLPLCVGVCLLSKQLMTGLYGSKFAASGPCLALLVWARIGAFTSLPGQQGVIARNAQLSLIAPHAIRAILNVSLNMYLIPRYGPMGAAASMVVAENIYYVLIYLMCFRGPERFSVWGIYGRPALATLVMAFVVLLLRPFGIILATIGGIITYGMMVPVFRLLDPEDKKILSALVKEFKGGKAVPG